MHIIWKRPDGFQNAQPTDFRRVALSNGAQLWLHNHETDWYPFQVSGDWAGQEQTARLNRLVNLLGAPDSQWKEFLERYHDNDLGSNSDLPSTSKFLKAWLEDILANLKGNTWEVEIMRCALVDIQKKLQGLH